MKVSVIMTAYNTESYIEEAITSVLGQTYDDIELIVVNDCSTDGTLKIVNSIADERIRVINNEKNLGCGMSRRIGIDASSGEYIMTVDSDDWLDADYIENLVANAIETGADIVSSGITMYGSNGYWKKLNYGNVIFTGDDKILTYWGNEVVFINNKLIRKDIAMKHKYCSRRYIEDTPTIIPWLWYANKVSYISGTGYHYRYNEKSLTHTKTAFKHILYSLLCVLDLNDFFLEKQPNLSKALNFEKQFDRLQQSLVELQPSNKDFQEHLNAWMEYSRRMLLK